MYLVLTNVVELNAAKSYVILVKNNFEELRKCGIAGNKLNT